nr:murein hydrolase activator EnvC [Candidatus Doolittlea endobia]
MFCAAILPLSAEGHNVDDKQQLKTAQQSILAKEKNVQQQKQHADLLSQLQEQIQSIVHSTYALRDTQRSLETLQSNIDKFTRSMHHLQNPQAAQQKLLAQQLNAAFRYGRYSELPLIFNNEESLRNERILAYFNYLSEVRTKTINDLRQNRIDFLTKRKRKQQQKQQQQQVLHFQKKQQQTLQSIRSACQQTLNHLHSSIVENKRRLVEIYQNKGRLRDTITCTNRKAQTCAKQEKHKVQRMGRLENQENNYGSTYKLSTSKRALVSHIGGLNQPTGQDSWPVRGRMLHRFGELQQGELRYKGLVIAAPKGRIVKTIAAGRVLMADWLQGYGLMIVIEHGSGDMSLYGYNQSALVNVGDQVKAGQPIALVGANSSHGTSSLYFEIRRQGQAVNPIPWLKQ